MGIDSVAIRSKRLACAAIFGITALSLNVLPATAAMYITPSGTNPVQHIVDCWHALFNDGPAHAANCEPGPMPPGQLAPTFSSPSAPSSNCYNLGEWRGVTGDALVAALGDPREIIKVAANCCTCNSAIVPLFTTFEVASIGRDEDDLRLRSGQGQHYAQSCCPD